MIPFNPLTVVLFLAAWSTISILLAFGIARAIYLRDRRDRPRRGSYRRARGRDRW